ncbi:type II toxin-antitoxin system RelE/ParE family toxin [Thioalkalivibrio sp.]|uniref:type II toxin-antitoxin system RelE/ParE family toxin n=1 Tax=Thioalkalivibrio sp. TaxID=2093813 RepID=UPI003569844C
MRVHWTRSAQKHLDAIYAYIAQDSGVYALRTVDRITARSRQIGTFPWSGRRVPEYDRETVREVFDGPYRIIYQINEAQVDVIAVIHGARDLREPPAHS